MHKRGRDYGIKGYDPTRKLPTRVAMPCPHCWRVYYSKSTLTAHINREHWDKDE